MLKGTRRDETSLLNGLNCARRGGWTSMCAARRSQSETNFWAQLLKTAGRETQMLLLDCFYKIPFNFLPLTRGGGGGEKINEFFNEWKVLMWKVATNVSQTPCSRLKGEMNQSRDTLPDVPRETTPSAPIHPHVCKEIRDFFSWMRLNSRFSLKTHTGLICQQETNWQNKTTQFPQSRGSLRCKRLSLEKFTQAAPAQKQRDKRKTHCDFPQTAAVLTAPE